MQFLQGHPTTIFGKYLFGRRFEIKYAYIYRLNTKIRLTMQWLSGFELYPCWVPLFLLQTKQSFSSNGIEAPLFSYFPACIRQV